MDRKNTGGMSKNGASANIFDAKYERTEYQLFRCSRVKILASEGTEIKTISSKVLTALSGF
jgi:hypothetical protein